MRVAAIACELGRRLGFAAADLDNLKWATLRHHTSHRLPYEAFDRMTADVLGGAIMPPVPHPATGPKEEILRAFTDARRKTLQVYTFVEVLTIAEAIDICLEYQPFTTVDAAEASMWESPFTQAGLSVIRRSDRETMRRIAARLPPFPDVALNVLQTLMREDLDTQELERLALADPVLSGAIVAQAGSSGRDQRDAGVSRAIAELGSAAARRLMITALMRPIYQLDCMRPLWRHAVESADAAAHLAQQTRLVKPSEAALAGLVHDIGALTMSMLDPEAVSAKERLLADGCPHTTAEWIVCGFDHAEAGAVVLERWGFPPDVIEAVRFHHAPEKSDIPLAAVLYLTEFWTGGDEDLPSTVRLNAAAERLRISPEAVYVMRPARVASAAEHHSLQAVTM